MNWRGHTPRTLAPHGVLLRADEVIRLRRRHVLCFVIAAALPVRAQRPQRPARIGFLSARRGPNEFEQAFMRGMLERGLVEGTDFVIDYRWADGDLQRLQAITAEVVAAMPDVVVASDGGVARYVRALNPAIPMVAPTLGDPIASGYSRSFSRPDGNITGVSLFATELSAKRLELLKDAVPGLQRVGAVLNAARPPAMNVSATLVAGEALGIKVIDMRMTLPDGITAGFASAVRQGVQGIVVISDTSTIGHRAPLCDAALAHRLPAIFANRTYIRAGGLMSYGPDLEGAFHRAAYFVDRILKGARPADLPIEQPTRFELVIDMNVAKALGLTIPKSVLLRADEVIR